MSDVHKTGSHGNDMSESIPDGHGNDMSESIPDGHGNDMSESIPDGHVLACNMCGRKPAGSGDVHHKYAACEGAEMRIEFDRETALAQLAIARRALKAIAGGCGHMRIRARAALVEIEKAGSP